MCGFVCWKQFPVGKVRRFIFRFIKTTVLARDNAGAGRVSRSFISVWIRHSRFSCIIPTQNCVKVFVVFFSFSPPVAFRTTFRKLLSAKSTLFGQFTYMCSVDVCSLDSRQLYSQQMSRIGFVDVSTDLPPNLAFSTQL